MILIIFIIILSYESQRILIFLILKISYAESHRELRQFSKEELRQALPQKGHLLCRRHGKKRQGSRRKLKLPMRFKILIILLNPLHLLLKDRQTQRRKGFLQAKVRL